MARIRCSEVEEEVQLEVFCDCLDKVRVCQWEKSEKVEKRGEPEKRNEHRNRLIMTVVPDETLRIRPVASRSFASEVQALKEEENLIGTEKSLTMSNQFSNDLRAWQVDIDGEQQCDLVGIDRERRYPRELSEPGDLTPNRPKILLSSLP